MKRGDLVLGAAPGDYGKVRPLVIVQNDILLDTSGSLILCMISSTATSAPLLRIPIEPSPANGLTKPSVILADKIFTLPRTRIKERIGQLDEDILMQLNRSLALVMGLGG